MKCPVCDLPLSISSRDGVEIDFCPQCRGVWLDRGELDKIIDRVNASTRTASRMPPPPPPPPSSAPQGDRPRPDRSDDRYDRDRDRRDGRDHHYPDDRRYDDRRNDWDRGYDKRKRRRSFLEDIFDFD